MTLKPIKDGALMGILSAVGSVNQKIYLEIRYNFYAVLDFFAKTFLIISCSEFGKLSKHKIFCKLVYTQKSSFIFTTDKAKCFSLKPVHESDSNFSLLKSWNIRDIENAAVHVS